MKPTLRSFNMFMRQLGNDGMLIMMMIAPILAGVFFRFVVPFAESLLIEQFNQTSILSDYYLLFDLFLIALAPYMFCFAASMTMLDEYDTNVTQHLIVTPIGKRGYVLSRLLYTTIIAILYSWLLISVFSLTNWGVAESLLFAIVSSFFGISLSLALFAFSKNKVEGLALAKLAGLFLMGLPVPFFVSDARQYLIAFLPSLWMAKLKMEFSLLGLFALILTASIWYTILYAKFIRKLSS
ncbi:MAG: hypothetical protein EA374_00095 [Acholeplasmatales bacterium]|nr:MAG: hypothetical protein EA374_00095 [Acholeplasmatales bacterium]